MCIYESLLLHQSDDFIDFTLNCPPHILQQNCAHVKCVQPGCVRTPSVWN